MNGQDLSDADGWTTRPCPHPDCESFVVYIYGRGDGSSALTHCPMNDGWQERATWYPPGWILTPGQVRSWADRHHQWRERGPRAGYLNTE